MTHVILTPFGAYVHDTLIWRLLGLSTPDQKGCYLLLVAFSAFRNDTHFQASCAALFHAISLRSSTNPFEQVWQCIVEASHSGISFDVDGFLKFRSSPDYRFRPNLKSILVPVKSLSSKSLFSPRLFDLFLLFCTRYAPYLVAIFLTLRSKILKASLRRMSR